MFNLRKGTGGSQRIPFNFTLFLLRHCEFIRTICHTIFIGGVVLLGLIMFHAYHNISAMDDWYTELSAHIEESTEYSRRTIISTNYQLMQNHAKSLRDAIDDRIAKEYGNDKTRLYNDLTQYYETNSLDNPLFKIFGEEGYGYINKWFPLRDDVHVIVTDRSHILFASSRSETMRQVGEISPLLFNFTEDQMLSVCPRTGKLTAIDPNEMAKDPLGFQDKYVINVAYIYDHEDIFGVRDVYPDGTLTGNNKLAIILEYKPFSARALQAEKMLMENMESTKDYQFAKTLSVDLTWTAVVLLVIVIAYLVYSKLPPEY